MWEMMDVPLHSDVEPHHPSALTLLWDVTLCCCPTEVGSRAMPGRVLQPLHQPQGSVCRAAPQGCDGQECTLAPVSTSEVVWKIGKNKSSTHQGSDWLLVSVQKAI